MSVATVPAGLRMTGISLSFGGLRALNEVSLLAHPGEVVGVIGPNGAGKTSLFNVLCGFASPDAGEIQWRGERLIPRPDRLAAAGIARTQQSLGLCDSLTVAENVQLGADRFHRAGMFATALGLGREARSERELRVRSQALLERYGLDDVAHASPADLPYPQRKRVALARALVSEPDLLLLDEPAGGLGESEIAELAQAVRDVQASGRTVILVEHHMDFVLQVCTRLYVLDAGRLIAEGDPREVVALPAVMEAYLGLEVSEEDR